jgi:hypothetical protein
MRRCWRSRILQFEDGTPFFHLVDTAGELVHRLTREEATRYLEDRVGNGFTGMPGLGAVPGIRRERQRRWPEVGVAVRAKRRTAASSASRVDWLHALDVSRRRSDADDPARFALIAPTPSFCVPRADRVVFRCC